MVADIRVREEVGRVTAWLERSRKGARRSVCYRGKTNPRGGSLKKRGATGVEVLFGQVLWTS